MKIVCYSAAADVSEKTALLYFFHNLQRVSSSRVWGFILAVSLNNENSYLLYPFKSSLLFELLLLIRVCEVSAFISVLKFIAGILGIK